MGSASSVSKDNNHWGDPPWESDFRAAPHELPQEVDCAVVGGGFTGLAAAAWLRRLAPLRTVALFESGSVGFGASGRTGGLALAETAAGDLPGLGDVLAGLVHSLNEFKVDCDLTLPGVWELTRAGGLRDSAICWADSGELRAGRLVPGGTISPNKLVAGLAHAAENLGARLFEHAEVTGIDFAQPLRLKVLGREVVAQNVLLATNAMSLELSGLADRAAPKLTLAAATEPLSDTQLENIGLARGQPFYTTDLPYLWGRLLATNRIVFGSGLVHVKQWRELANIDISTGEAAQCMVRLEERVRGLHPAMQNVKFTHRWGGPILIANDWRPVFSRHPQNTRALVLGGYSGHGVALSVHLGHWAAQAMLGMRELPDWHPTHPEP